MQTECADGCKIQHFICAKTALWVRADIEIQANEILHHKLTLNGYLAEFTGQSMDTITQVRLAPVCPRLWQGKTNC